MQLLVLLFRIGSPLDLKGRLIPLRVQGKFNSSLFSSSKLKIFSSMLSTVSTSKVVQFAKTQDVPLAAARSTIEMSQKRSADGEPAGQPPQKQLKTRTCIRCGNTDGCSGRQYWYRCTNPCRDCNKRTVLECAGRSSRKPNVQRCVPARDLNSDDLTKAAKLALGLGQVSSSQPTFSFHNISSTS